MRGLCLRRVKAQVHVQAGVLRLASRRMLGIGAGRMVAQRGDAPAHLVPGLVQLLQGRAKLQLGVTPHLHHAAVVGLADEVGVAAQAVGAQQRHHLVAHRGGHLQHHAQFLVEQGAQRQLVAALTHLGGPVLGITVLGAAVANAVAFGDQDVHVQAHAPMAGKGHFAHGGPQAPIAAVVAGQQPVALAQGVHGGHQGFQRLGVVQVRHAVTKAAQHLRQHGAAQAHAALAQVHQHQGGVAGLQLRRHGAAHIVQRGEGRDDERHRRHHLVGLPVLARPARAHGQRILAHRDADAQRRAQLQPDGAHGVVQGRVFARLAAGGHPVGAELDAGQVNGRAQQVGDGLTHGHAARGRRIQRSERRALAHAHGLTAEALEVRQRHRAVGHRHLPGAHHLVAVREAAHGAVADGDEEALARHRGVAQHVQAHLRERHPGEVQRRGRARHTGHVTVHLRRLAQQHVHGHVDGTLA